MNTSGDLDVTNTTTLAAAAAPIYIPALLTSFIVPVTFGIVGVVGIFGNALVILVVVTNAQMRSTTNVLILNLAFADLLFIVFCVPFTATDYAMNGTWPFGPPVGMLACQAVQYLIYVTSSVSIYTLILMSVDRFLAVVFPVRNSFSYFTSSVQKLPIRYNSK